MTPGTFIQNFELLAEAPGGVPKLRELVLQLAVRGKLVPQDPRDRPRVILRDVSKRIHYGYTASANPAITDVRLLRITDIQDNRVQWESVPGCEIDIEDVPKYELSSGDILIARTGGTIGKTYLITETPVRAVFASYLIRVVPSNRILPPFLKLFLESPDYWEQLRLKSAGTGQPNVNGQALGSLKLDLPPLTEQKQIVARVDELMKRCDELEARQKEQDERRKKLTASCLHAITSASHKSAAPEIRRALDNFSLLIDTPESVAELRKTILQLAVQGRLVPQDPKDEPAETLMKKIVAEKLKHKVGKTATVAPITDKDLLFDLPTHWAWARLGTLCLNITDGTHYTPKYINDGIPFLSVKNVSGGQIDFSNTRFIAPEEHAVLSKRCRPEKGDILLTKVGTTGIAVAVDIEVEFSIFVSLALLKVPRVLVHVPYMTLALNSPHVKMQSERDTQGVGNKNLVLRFIREFTIPLPPIAEQKRIVEKVNGLMSLCDALEANLAQSHNDADTLVAAVVHHLCSSGVHQKKAGV